MLLQTKQKINLSRHESVFLKLYALKLMWINFIYSNRVTSLEFVLSKNLLISAGEDSILIFWDLNADRKEVSYSHK